MVSWLPRPTPCLSETSRHSAVCWSCTWISPPETFLLVTLNRYTVCRLLLPAPAELPGMSVPAPLASSRANPGADAVPVPAVHGTDELLSQASDWPVGSVVLDRDPVGKASLVGADAAADRSTGKLARQAVAVAVVGSANLVEGSIKACLRGVHGAAGLLLCLARDNLAEGHGGDREAGDGDDQYEQQGEDKSRTALPGPSTVASATQSRR